ncbi:hypothetical protein GCM10028807_51560 [Spirosoma daeguense]
MQIFGYILFGIVTLCYVGLAMLTASKPNLTGDSAMGYGLGLAFFGLAFTLSSLALTIVANLNGGFASVSSEPSTRTMFVMVVWLLVALSTFFCAVFKWEWHGDSTYPQFLRWMAVYQGQIWAPLPWLMVCLLALNPGWQASLPGNSLKILFWISLAINGLYSGGLLVGYFRDAARTAEVKMAARTEDEKRWHQIRLDEIAAHKPSDSILGLLKYSSPYQDSDVRQAALIKIKSHPDWEAQLLTLLQNKYYCQEVYYFLNGNAVDHPDQFIQPLQQSITTLSERIRAEIIDSNNLQSWSFDSYGIEHLLDAIDGQFKQQRNDLYPSVLKLKKALVTKRPERFKDVYFAASDVVERWLKTNHK